MGDRGLCFLPDDAGRSLMPGVCRALCRVVSFYPACVGDIVVDLVNPNIIPVFMFLTDDSAPYSMFLRRVVIES